MTITYPITPSVKTPINVDVEEVGNDGFSESPFSFEQNTQQGQGQRWEMALTFPPMEQADAQAVIGGFLGAMYGQIGTALLPIFGYAGQLGTWAGSPKVLGAHAARVTSIAMDGFSVGATVKAGDLLQTGSGSSTHLHRVCKDATADGSGLLTLEVWPPTRAALADNDTFTTTSPLGIWRLKSSRRRWSIQSAAIYGVSVELVEAL